MNEFYNLPVIVQEDLDKQEYQHRLKYQLLYIRLIERCKSMTLEELSGYNEKHHILPRCMGGSDKKDNIVLLPVRYHIMAHLLLLETYPDHTGISYAAHCMINGIKDYRAKSVQKYFSTRTIADAREKALKNMIITDEQKEKISRANKGRKLTPEQLKKWSEVKKGDKNAQYGKHLSDDVRNKISRTVKSHWENGTYKTSDIFKKRGENSHAKKVVGPDTRWNNL